MKRYYVNNNAQQNGDHEVHVETCSLMPNSGKDLGLHSSCESAVKDAKRTYPQSNGCYYCCYECHTS